jgi:ribosomal protein S27AE
MEPSCNAVFPKSVLANMVPKHWLNTHFKEHQNNIRFKKQSIYFPEAMGEVDRRSQIARKGKELKALRKELNEKYAEIDKIYKPKIKHIEEEINKLIRTTAPKKHFSKPCSLDKCKGLLDESGTCGICNKKTCQKCLEYIENEEEEHTCDEETVKTAELIKKETKNCPSCGEGIFKINGCDLMYCTLCNTAFSWKTGKIETKNIHNPHYFEYLRRNAPNGEIPRAPGDEVVIDGNVDCLTMDQILSQLRRVTFNVQFKDRLFQLIRLKMHCRHIYDNIMIRLDNTLELKELRVQYLLEYITQDAFKKRISTIYKRTDMLEESHMLIQSIELVSETIIKKYAKIILGNRNNRNVLDTEYLSYNREIENLKYLIYTANNENEKISRAYKMANDYILYNDKNQLVFGI